MSWQTVSTLVLLLLPVVDASSTRAVSPLPAAAKHTIVIHGAGIDPRQSSIDSDVTALLDEAVLTARNADSATIVIAQDGDDTAAEAARLYLVHRGIEPSRIATDVPSTRAMPMTSRATFVHACEAHAD